MDAKLITVTIQTLLSLGGLWALFFWLYRDYRLDLFRQKLFSVRDDLFDLGAEGKVSFDSPAYGLLRTMINGIIRYGHRLGLLDGLCFHLFTRKTDLAHQLAKGLQSKWDLATGSLPSSTRKELNVLRGRLHYLMVEQVLFTSPLLILTIIPITAWVILSRFSGLTARWMRSMLGDDLVNGIRNEIDAAAVARGADDGPLAPLTST